MNEREKLMVALAYDAETGVFSWKENPFNNLRDKRAGTKKTDGYIQLSFAGKFYPAHRVAWLFINGEWPSQEIDHKNGIRDDNRIANLRDVSKNENQHNQRHAHKNSASGVLGVSKCSFTGRWQVVIQKDGKQKHIGRYDTVEEARGAYLSAKRVLHPSAEVSHAA